MKLNKTAGTSCDSHVNVLAPTRTVFFTSGELCFPSSPLGFAGSSDRPPEVSLAKKDGLTRTAQWHSIVVASQSAALRELFTCCDWSPNRPDGSRSGSDQRGVALSHEICRSSNLQALLLFPHRLKIHTNRPHSLNLVRSSISAPCHSVTRGASVSILLAWEVLSSIELFVDWVARAAREGSAKSERATVDSRRREDQIGECLESL